MMSIKLARLILALVGLSVVSWGQVTSIPAAAGLASQYVDWTAASGGASIANKPTLGTAAQATIGTGVGQVPVTGDYLPANGKPATAGVADSATGNAGSVTNGLYTTTPASILGAPFHCIDAGANDSYACDLAPAITAYTTGQVYRFKANTINTGAATINFNSKGALPIKKLAGAITTVLADNDIRAGQWVECVYDGTNCQMVSQLGNDPTVANAMTQAVANSAANTLSVSVGTSGTAFAKTPVTVDPSTGAIGGTVSLPGTAVPFTQTGTGAVATTQYEINRRVVSVKDFGASGSATTTTTVGTTAVGTSVTLTSASTFAAGQGISIAGAGVGGALYVGSITVLAGAVTTITPATGTQVSAGAAVGHSDTAALTAALTAHKHVKVPAGTYVLTSMVTPPSGATLEGEGGYIFSSSPTTQFVGAFAGPVFSIPVTGSHGVRFANFSLTCSSTASSVGFGIGGTDNANWAVRTVLDDVSVGYCGDNILAQNAWGMTFSRVVSTDALRYGLYLHPPSGGYTTTVLIDNHSEFQANGSSGIFADGQNVTITIRDSMIESNGATDASFTGTAHALSIDNTYFENALTTPVLTIANNYAPKINLTGNHFRYTTQSLGTNVINAIGNNGLGDTLTNTAASLNKSSTIGVTSGADLVTNGTFGADSGWTKQTGWTIDGTTAVATAVAGGAGIYQDISASVGVLYKVTYTVVVTSGAVEFAIEGGRTTRRSASGTYTEYIGGVAADTYLYIMGYGFTGTVDNVSVYLVSPVSITGTIASGATAMGTSEIGENACATVVTVAATGVLATDVISFTPNASIKAVTGYAPAGTLSTVAYPTAGNVNFDVCNKDQTNHVTPGAVTLNWRVSR